MAYAYMLGLSGSLPQSGGYDRHRVIPHQMSRFSEIPTHFVLGSRSIPPSVPPNHPHEQIQNSSLPPQTASEPKPLSRHMAGPVREQKSRRVQLFQTLKSSNSATNIDRAFKPQEHVYYIMQMGTPPSPRPHAKRSHSHMHMKMTKQIL